MKQSLTILNSLLAAGLVILLIYAGLPLFNTQTVQANPVSQAATPQNACDSSRTVQVTGSAMINVTPDRAQITLGVQSNGVTVDGVQLANTIAIQRVINAIKNQGIEANDIATDIYIIEPVYESYDSLYIKGYRINNVIAVTLRDIKKTSSVLSTALSAGANQVIGVDFYTSELRKYRDQARALAVKAAREKAQALASAAGADTGCVLSINENTWSYYNGWWYGRSQNQWTQNVVQNAASSGSASTGSELEPVSLGQISIKAEVGVTYSLE